MSVPGSNFEYEIADSRQSWAGLIMLILAAMSAIACVGLLYGAQDDYLRLGAAAGFAVLTWLLSKAGKRRRIPVLSGVDALTALAERTGIPVAIYLRRFVDDEQTSHPPAEESSSQDRDEIQLAESFSQICLFVAVGRPGEPLPPWGAYRLYLDDDEWEGKVEELISIASIIFFKWADSDPLSREIQLVKHAGKLDRTVFLLPMKETPEELRHFLPDETLVQFNTPSKPTDQEYAAFLTLHDSETRLHYRDRKVSYGEAARRVVVDSFGMTELSKRQMKVMRGFYGRLENWVNQTLRFALYTFAGSLGLSMLLIVAVLAVEKLPDSWVPFFVADFVDMVAFNAFEVLGWVLACCLGILLLLVVLAQRVMP